MAEMRNVVRKKIEGIGASSRRFVRKIGCSDIFLRAMQQRYGFPSNCAHNIGAIRGRTAVVPEFRTKTLQYTSFIVYTYQGYVRNCLRVPCCKYIRVKKRPAKGSSCSLLHTTVVPGTYDVFVSIFLIVCYSIRKKKCPNTLRVLLINPELKCEEIQSIIAVKCSSRYKMMAQQNLRSIFAVKTRFPPHSPQTKPDIFPRLMSRSGTPMRFQYPILSPTFTFRY